MAAATVSSKAFGYTVGGGNSATTVTTEKVYLKGIHVYGTAGNETVSVVDTAGNRIAFFTLTAVNTAYLPCWGAVYEGLAVTLSATTVTVNFIL